MGQHMSSAVGYLSNITNMNLESRVISTKDGQTSAVNNHSNTPKRQRYNAKRIPKDCKLSSNELQQVTNDVLDLIFDWFPELHDRTYFLPPVHMNRVTYKVRSIGGREVQAIQQTPESDWRDDEVMQRTLACLRALTDHCKEPMVVLLQMQHDNYLNKPCYAAAASHYPRPADLDTHLRRGDFDLLFLHRNHGVIVAEIKSVGWRPGGDQDDATVKKKVRQAVDQLNKARTVLTHLTSDVVPLPRITTTLILPNVPSNRLRGLLGQDSQLAEDFCKCLGQSSIQSAISVCLGSQHMTSLHKPADVTPHILQELTDWWHRLLASGETTPGCTPQVYELLVARFCGPASTVQVHCVRPPRLEFRTLAHAVQEVGERMVQFVLFPEQLALLQEVDEECVYLTGPPGTGKTLMLMLVALQWCRKGHTVHIVSTGTFSEAATHLLYYQVTKTLAESDTEAVSRIHIHLNGNNIDNVRNILSDLLAVAKVTNPSQRNGQGSDPEQQERELSNNTIQNGGQLFLVVDEVGEKFREFFEVLRTHVGDLHMWAASYRKEFRPPGMMEKTLFTCLRSTPTVRRRMETAISFAAKGVDSYQDRRQDYLSVSDGPAELFLSHEGHSADRAMDCEECGHAIAHCLHHQLAIGKKKGPATSVKLPSALQYSDVIIIPDYYQDIDDLRDDQEARDHHMGKALKASGIVRGLRACRVPTYVVTKQDAATIQDLARASREAVAVVAWGVSNGLERKVVVSVGQGRSMVDGRMSGVLHGASRCVSQLVYIMCPDV
ncbi:uncharacterized protein LOC143291184 [Babylonia areolata]|uniref:uncharacterized protein LOC143291184 n=1 Tax=Babylonia areolata TaxID=304850 RepID=UPI003FD5BDEB